MADAIGARLLKRLVQAHEAFAAALLQHLAGDLLKWSKQGAGWVVLALLESPRTGASVRGELKGAGAALGKSSAAGCRSLAGVLGTAKDDAPHDDKPRAKKAKKKA